MDTVRCPVCGHGFSASELVCPCCHTRLPERQLPWLPIIVAIAIVLGLIVLALAI